MQPFQMLAVFSGAAAAVSLPVLEARGPGCPADSVPTNITLCEAGNPRICECTSWLMTGGFVHCGNPLGDPTVGYNPIYPTAYYPSGCDQNGYVS
ncbi:hypothetical protein JX265_006948 [Neoarthrinium moseri]|uniref:Uncharacterized protein n=1 Tax=Neoarthrinium moseri TaxID=1658444 RepID=A0A9P9WL32_9PEZI|nr:uncharacterized protein JN550_002577 [Neoarthrinium moseri]KAI1845214.1 hypothetical protein JX266_008761 [Neoarthrinium moseri]KAI1868969.1 hypothetical protein JX265_006948 [Neoarthrinium moseri]KAI1873998.1 hypothetical protein JN550_002577 [Neoarthrinium moseri]